jgi:phosphate:Na+ symporter
MALALKAYEKQDLSLLPQIKSMEDEVDEMVSMFTKNHFRRLKDKLCTSKSGVVFTDTLSDLEKCADSAEKIAFFMESKE